MSPTEQHRIQLLPSLSRCLCGTCPEERKEEMEKEENDENVHLFYVSESSSSKKKEKFNFKVAYDMGDLSRGIV